MAYYDTTQYVNAGDQLATGYYAVPKRAAGATVHAGQIVRQATPALNEERCFICIIAGVTGGGAPTWTVTRGGKTADGGVTWQECTGSAAVNGDDVNTPTWAVLAHKDVSLGQIIKRINGASYHICSSAGTAGVAEPAFNDVAGATAVDGSAIWTCIGKPGDFHGGGAPHARIQNAGAPTWWQVSGTIWVGDNHAEAQATELTFSTDRAPDGPTTRVGKMLCHNHAGNYPPTAADLRTGATVALTAAGNLRWAAGGPFYVYGMTFKCGVGDTSFGPKYILIETYGGYGGVFALSQNWTEFDSCSFWLCGTKGGGAIYLSNSGFFNAPLEWIIWTNTTVSFSTAGQAIIPQFSQLRWRNTGPVLAPGSIIPSYLFTTNQIGGMFSEIVCEALDLSQLATKLWFNDFASGGLLMFKHCRLNPQATVDGGAKFVGQVIQFSGCDAGNAAYKSSRWLTEGTELTETVIVRSGGAADPSGQQQSRRITTKPAAEWVRPYRSEAMAVWNSSLGNPLTVTLRGITPGTDLPLNDEIWVEAEYLADPATTLGTIIAGTKASILAPNGPVATDGSSWSNISHTMFDFGTSWSVLLSDGNRVVQLDYQGLSPSGWPGARSLSYQSTGRYYFEVEVNAAHGLSSTVGIIPAASDYNLSGFYAGMTVEVPSGRMYSNGAARAQVLGAINQGDVIGVCVDFVVHKGWMRKNAGYWNGDPAADPLINTGGLSLPSSPLTPAVGFNLNPIAGDRFTLNCGWAPYAAAPPFTFTNWPSGGVNSWSKFKLTAVLNPAPMHQGYINVRVCAAKPSTLYFIDPLVTLS